MIAPRHQLLLLLSGKNAQPIQNPTNSATATLSSILTVVVMVGAEMKIGDSGLAEV